ncbi:C4-dicarboxylate ABC transporter substrate-binding protein [Mameliella alba]|uniref:TAXI family TRAP transporter solute-binding subunit n=1 Tax=Mameliella TaxID=1434019 RepID=UPI000B52AECA|nr:MULTISPECIES: TAXI family TRAP transporter solute-binding subunit [Mameliella]MCR9275538.1 TAXI family TRAP transporter solute-binding subunit [Paracoccaceae bacterium]OWV53341.1 hypothetical protein CDZ98_23790 [Mameliella alba]BBU55304.1 C4-dicarboxylate ABC transporter substrate-binding protein [Mameliella alba]
MRIFAAIAALSGALWAGQVSAQAPVAIGTNPQGSLAYVSGSAIANIVGKSIGRSFIVVPLGGPSAIIPAMADREFDFSFANITAAAQAYAGVGSFEGRPYPGLRIATVVYPLELGIISRQGDGIEKIEDLAGKRVASEYTSQRNLDVFMNAAFMVSGMSFDDVQPIPVQNGVQAIDELIDGSLDASIFSISAGAVAKADASVGVTFVNLPDGEAEQAALADLAPGASIGRTTARTGQDATVITAPFVILVTDEVDDETVYQVVAGIARNAEHLAKADPQFGKMSLDMMADPKLPIPYHPGAIRFFEEQGVWE